MFDKLQYLLTALCGVCLLGMGLSHIPGFIGPTPDQWAVGAVAAGSVFAVRTGWEALRDRRLDVNLLMILAAIGAITVGHIDDAAVLLFLFSLSSALESLAMARTESAIEALVKLKPSTAIRIRDERDETVAVENLQTGDEVRVLPFENIPVDGTLLSANASVNEAAMTGESLPVEKTEGAELTAGTQNLDRMLTLQVTHPVENSTLQRMIDLVREAQTNQASGERISTWFGARYTFFVLGVFAVALAARLVTGSTWMDALYPALTLLVALSPCALVIASPAASLSALAFAARKGALVRGGQFLERAGHITRVALDKTGTLTEGRPQVVEVCVSEEALAAVGTPQEGPILCWHLGDPHHDRSESLIAVAAAAESFSTHPIAESIVRFARNLGVSIPAVENQNVVPGMGVEAQIEGRTVRVGQAKFFGQELPTGFRDHVEEMRSRGLTSVLVHDGLRWAAIGLRDEPRPEAAAFLEDLRRSGVKHIAMLTGDNPQTAHAVAQDLGISEVHAGLLPEDKLRLVQQWEAQGERVMMVGDGVNDAPALSASSLGVGMGGLGSEAALRASRVVLVRDRIALLPMILRLGRKTNRIIRANLIFAATVILCLVVASFFTTLPLAIAVVGHEGSTALVVLNGLRLLAGPGK